MALPAPMGGSRGSRMLRPSTGIGFLPRSPTSSPVMKAQICRVLLLCYDCTLADIVSGDEGSNAPLQLCYDCTRAGGSGAFVS
jgi:hypothetical protein